jgi:1-acyl-sn-glycerol-3-phosphate acyltransferase
MIRTILWYGFFWLYQLVSLSFFIPLAVLRLFKLKEREKAYIHFITSSWARNMIRAAGGRITVQGLHHIPKDQSYCIIANHQGGFDIPLLVGYMPRSVGFIAKKELRYVPVLSTWMKAVNCIFIDRSNRRAAAASIKQAVEQIKQGQPLVIFPEGTRSRGPEMNPFKSGSLKVPIRSKALIVPVTIDGTHLMKEANGGLLRPASVTLTVHQPVEAAAFEDDQTQDLAQLLEQTIGAALSGKGSSPEN